MVWNTEQIFLSLNRIYLATDEKNSFLTCLAETAADNSRPWRDPIKSSYCPATIRKHSPPNPAIQHWCEEQQDCWQIHWPLLEGAECNASWDIIKMDQMHCEGQVGFANTHASTKYGLDCTLLAQSMLCVSLLCCAQTMLSIFVKRARHYILCFIL